MSPARPHAPTRPWARLGAAMAAQVGLLVAASGLERPSAAPSTEVRLRVRPSEPFDPLVGHHLGLRYEVAQAAEAADSGRGPPGPVWLELRPSDGSAWRLEAVLAAPPALPRVAVRAERDRRGRVRLDRATRLYVPEVHRAAIGRALADPDPRPEVSLRVSPSGAAAITRLHIGERIIDVDGSVSRP